MKYAHIVGWGSYLPKKVMTNDDLAEIVDTNDEWIYTRTGIRERRIANEKETTAKLLEFKIKYLVSYAALMRNYFIHMNFEDIITDLNQRNDALGKKILLVACMIVSP